MTRFIVPTSAEELEEILNDKSQMGELLKDKQQFGEFVRNYAAASSKKDTDIAAQVREQTQQVLAEFMRDNQQDGKSRVSMANGVPQAELSAQGGAYYQVRKNALYNKAAMGAAVDGKFTSQAEFFRALALQGGSVNRLRDGADLLGKLNQVSDIQNSFGSNAPADGGFLLPEQLRSDLLLLALEQGIIRPRATVIPMSTQRVGIPAVDTTSNVSTVFGGIQTYWLDEGTAPTESSAKFQQVWLDAKKLMAYCTAPNELIADTNAFGAFLEAALPQAIAFEEDYRFMQGNGSAQPLGYVSCPGAVTASAVTGQGANTIIVDNLAAMYARMLPSSLGKAIWVASIDCFPQLALMAVSGALGNSSPVWMTANAPGVPGIANSPPMSIYGRPLYWTEKHPALGTSGDIMFVDPSFYLVGDRQSIEVSASPHFLFSTDKTAYKVIERVDGRPWLQSAVTPKNNSSSTLSAFVQLSGTRT